MLFRSIESSQQKVEGRNFAIRKNVLQYDDVMNRQREIIYGQRDQVLNGENLRADIIKMINQNIEETASLYCADDTARDNWNLESLREYYNGWILNDDDLKYSIEDLEDMEKIDIVEELQKRALELYEENEKLLAEDTMREMERVYLLKSVDTYWMQHIDDMENLKQGIRLRAYGQKDPVVEYRFEGFDMFDEMIAAIRENTAKLCLSAPKKIAEIQIRQAAAEAARRELQKRAAAAHQVNINQPAEQPAQPQPVDIVIEREQVAKPTATSSDGTDNQSKTIRKTAKQKVGRNDPCPCGSGKKYKKCCGKDE